MTATLILGQHIGLTLKLCMRRNRTWLAQNLSALNFFTLGTPKQYTNIIASFTLIQQLAEHLNSGARRLGGVFQANNLNLFTNIHNPALNTARYNRTTTRDREHIFNRHQKWLILRSVRLRNISINRIHQFLNRILANLSIAIFQRCQCRTLNNRNIIAGEVI
ncbi:MAG: Uncharacterised protein [Rhodospirillaceae bacterium]|nr:MAG: Uncharacterised protein [Rhodospirillaceae bacterium]